MAITVRELLIKLNVKGNAGDKLAKFGLAVNGVKAGLDILVGSLRAVTRATFGFVESTAAANDVIAKTSRTLSVSSAEFQRLSFAADRSGIAMKTMERAILNLNKGIAETGTSTGKLSDDAFKRLGISIDQLKLLNTEERIGFLGDALARVTDETQRTSIAQRIFGERAGPRLANLLREGSAGVKALGDEAARLGFVLSDEALAQSEKFIDSLTNMRAVITGVKRTIVVDLIPIVSKGVKQFQKWVIQNRELIKQRLSKLLNAMAKAFTTLLDKLDTIVATFESLVNILTRAAELFINITTALGGLERALKLATGAWIGYKVAQLAAVSFPLGAFIVTLGLLAGAFANVAADAKAATDEEAKFLKQTGRAKRVNVNREAAKIARAVEATGSLSPAQFRQVAEFPDILRGKIFSIARQRATKRTKTRTVRFGGEFQRIPGGKLTSASAKARQRISELEEQVTSFRGLAPSPTAVEDFGDEFVGPPLEGAGGPAGDKPAGGRKRKDTPKGPPLEELVAGAIKSGKLPSEAALLASTTPPIIIPITNNNVVQNIESNVSVTGVAGEDAAEILERVDDAVNASLANKFLEAIQELKPQLTR